MKIKCPRCSTAYQIDDLATSGEGVYARCSNCANVFFVRKRSAKEIEELKRKHATTASQTAKPAPKAENTEKHTVEQAEQSKTAEQSTTAEQSKTADVNNTETSPDNLSPEDVPVEEPAPVTADTPAPVGEPAGALNTQDDIDALLSANAPAETEPAPVEEPAGALNTQDDIDALLSANAPAETEPAPVEEPAGALNTQDDIDALLSANAPADMEPVSNSANEALDENVAKAEEEAEIISQDDIDALLVGSSEEVEESASLIDEDKGDTMDITASVEEALGASAGEGDELDKLLGDEEDSMGSEAPGEDAKHEDAELSDDEATLDQVIYDEEAMLEEGGNSADIADVEDDEMLGIPQSDEAEVAPVTAMDEEPSEMTGEDIGKTGFVSRMLEKIRQMLKGLTARGKEGPGGFTLKPGSLAIVSALVLAVALAGGGYWFFYGRDSKAKETMTASLDGKEKAADDTAQDESADNLLDDSLVAEDSAVTQPQSAVSVEIYLPVEFDTEISRIMAVTVSLMFDSATRRDKIQNRLFFATVTVENLIERFFRDKFYEQTVFVKDKLEEFVTKKLKKTPQFAGLVQARFDKLTFEAEKEEESESANL